MGQYCHLHAVQVEEDGCYSSQVGHGLAGLSVLDQDTVKLVLKVFHSYLSNDLSCNLICLAPGEEDNAQ